MIIFDKVNVDTTWIVFSVLILLFIAFSVYLTYNYKPSFVVPFSRVNKLKYYLQKSLIFFLLVLVVLLPLNLSILTWKQIKTEKTLNVQILFDVSLSMTADDIKPSRFNSAKSSVISLVNNLTWYNISMITFSWIPFMWAPFTTQTNALVSKLNDMSLGDFPPTLNFVWTAIGDALVLWISNLMKHPDETNKNPWIIILITDWDSNKWSDPIQASQIALNNNIPIYTLWIWSSDYIVWYDHYGSPVTTQINIPLLENIASLTQGKFYRVLSENDFKWIFEEISKYIKSSEIQNIENEYLYLNTYFYAVIVAILILLWAIRFYNYFSSK